MKEKVTIITGSSGEIGQNLIAHYSKIKNKKIIAIDLEKFDGHNKIFHFIKGSILDENILNSLSNKYIIDEIYHLAAILSTKAEKNPELAQEVNIKGTMNIFNIALNQNLKNKIITKVFFPSSIAVYKINSKVETYNDLINEDSYCNPKTKYGQHKLFCENIGTALDKYGNELNLKIDFRCIRFPGIISANTLPTGGTSDYAPEMIHHAFQKKMYTSFANQESCLPFIVMPDAINSILSIMNCKKNKLNKNVYNITSFSPTVMDLYKILKNQFPEFLLEYKIDKNRQNIINGWPNFIDDSQAKKDWGWEPVFNLKTAFTNYIYPQLKNNK